MKRNLNGYSKKFVMIYAILFTIIQILMLLITTIDPRVKYVSFVGFVISLTFLKYKPTKRSNDSIKIYDIVFFAIAVVSTVYYVSNCEKIVDRSLYPNIFDMIFAVVTIGLTLEATRRTIGNVLPIIAIIAILYAMYGNHLSGIWAHRQYSVSRVVNILYMTDNGIFGSVTKVAATTVFAFTIMGVFLKKTKIGNMLTDIVTSLTGKFYGGSALVAVISSSLFGMISGSAASNVVTTGQFTIPMMKKDGFESNFAAAVEAVASAGGTLTPPVLGAAVFVMMEIIGVPYNTIVKATLIPAVIYYTSVLFMVYFTARKQQIKGKENKIDVKKLLKENLVLFAPIVILVILIFAGKPLIQATLFSTALVIILSIFKKKIKYIEIIEGIGETGISALPTSMACICSGIIIGVLNLTGLSARFSEVIFSLSSLNIILALFATMIMLIFLGMGLPAVASYIIGASIAAPILISIGVSTLSAHLFIFYFSCLSSITPPVALNAYLASGIAESNPIKTALVSCKLCLPIFFIPYVMVFQPALMLDGKILGCIFTIFTSIFGTFLISIGIVGYTNKAIKMIERILIFMAGILFLTSKMTADILGCVIITGWFIFYKIQNKIIAKT